MPRDKKANAKHQKDRDDRQRALGRVGRKKWWTPEEHDKGDALIEGERLRGEDKQDSNGE